MRIGRRFGWLIASLTLTGLGVLGVSLHVRRSRQWEIPPGNVQVAARDQPHDGGHAHPHDEGHPLSEEVLRLSAEARANLGLRVTAVEPQQYWWTILVPGEIIDRPGCSDWEVTSPVVGVVTEVHAYPGDTVRPGASLFTLRLFSEHLQNAQSELFKATREIQLIEEQRARLAGAAQSGAIPQSRLIELENQLRRQTGLVQSQRQELQNRGLLPAQIDAAAQGAFVSTIDVVVPPPPPHNQPTGSTVERGEIRESGETVGAEPSDELPVYEVQALRVGLGQQVQAGQLLSTLSNHRELYIEGHAFKREATYLERAAQQGWNVDVEVTEDDLDNWPSVAQRFRIRHLANSIDVTSRTFAFYIPLVNQSRSYVQDGETFVVWRYRPGQRVRLHVPVEELHDVFVLPQAAVAREGPDAFVFVERHSEIERQRVEVLREDRRFAVVGGSSGLEKGVRMVQNAASTLNRILHARLADHATLDGHVHADGSSHHEH